MVKQNIAQGRKHWHYSGGPMNWRSHGLMAVTIARRQANKERRSRISILRAKIRRKR